MHWREQSSSSNVAQIKMVWVYCCFLPVLRETRNSGFPPGWGGTPFFGLNGYVPPNRLRFSGSWILIRVDNAKCTYPQAAAISPTTPTQHPTLHSFHRLLLLAGFLVFHSYTRFPSQICGCKSHQQAPPFWISWGTRWPYPRSNAGAYSFPISFLSK